MLSKIKKYADYIFGGVIIFLGALFYSQKKKTERAEAELAKTLSKEAIKDVDANREVAAASAVELESGYEDIKRRYFADEPKQEDKL